MIFSRTYWTQIHNINVEKQFVTLGEIDQIGRTWANMGKIAQDWAKLGKIKQFIKILHQTERIR